MFNRLEATTATKPEPGNILLTEMNCLIETNCKHFKI